jgi:hypothetical protein
MDDSIRHFVRHPDGTWECIAPAEINSPRGRIQVTPGSRFARGAPFMGVDVARWLDEADERARTRQS